MNCLFYHYITFFFFCYVIWHEVYFVWRNYGYPKFFGFQLRWESSFIPSPFASFSLDIAWVSWRQHIVGSFYVFVQPGTLFLVICEFNLFTFKVIINRWGPYIATLSFVFWLLYISMFLFPWVSVCHFGLMMIYDFFLNFLFYLYFMFNL